MVSLKYHFKRTSKQVVLAQLVERMAFNHVVVGSIPTDGEKINFVTNGKLI